ncbi:MAG TPA: hypothetical protein VFA85_03755 [Terriglobales bacterium]|nr:hypothetical protein [Terriglobales bacterium]
MKNTRLFLTFLIGAAFGCLSVLMIDFPDRVGPAVVFCLPGVLLAIIASGNVHDFNTWVVATGNFGFYFAGSNLAWWFWERHTREQ